MFALRGASVVPMAIGLAAVFACGPRRSDTRNGRAAVIPGYGPLPAELARETKLAKIGDQFGFSTTTDLDALITDASVDLVDICLPTWLHAETAVRAMNAGRDVLIELPLADTIADAHRIVSAQRATGRRAFAAGGRVLVDLCETIR